MTHSTWTAASLVTAVAALLTGIAGCSAEEPAGGGTTGADDDDDGAETTTGAGVGGQGPGTTTGPGAGGDSTTGSGSPADCDAATSFDKCYDCYAEDHPTGAEHLQTFYVDNCLCGTSAPCADDCASDCSEPQSMITDACQSCIDGLAAADTCMQDTISQCQEDSACTEFVSAAQACPE